MFDGDGLSSRVIVRVVAIIVALSLLVCFPRHIRFLQTQVDAQTQNVAFDAAASQTATYSTPSGNQTLTWSHSVGSGPNRILIVSISISGTPLAGNRVTAVTYGNAALTRIGSLVATNQTNAVEMFQLLSPASGAHTVTVNLVPLAQTYVAAGSMSFS